MKWLQKKIDKYLYKKFLERQTVLYQSIVHISELELAYMKDRDDYDNWILHHKKQMSQDIAHKMFTENNIKYEERAHNFGGLSLIAKIRTFK